MTGCIRDNNRRVVRFRLGILLAVFMSSVIGLTSAAPSSRASTQAVQYAVTDLGTLGGSICSGYSGQTSIATALNASGQAAGSSCKFTVPFNRVFGAFLWSGGTITDLGVTGTAHGINDAGQVVGGTGQPGFESSGSAFIWSGGTLTSLGPVLGGFSTAFDIDNRGRIVGLRGTPPNTASWRAFRYDTTTGAVTDLGTLGGTFRSTATSINDAGHIAGWASLPDENTFHAFLWRDGAMTDLGSLSSGHSFARGVNATDQVVGDSSVPEGTHAFLWKEGAMSDLGTLGGPFSAAYGINDIGHVVGYALTESFAQRAVVWRGGTIHDLNDLIPADSGWELREARAINTAGQIVGTGILGGETRAFLLTSTGDLTPPLLVVPTEMTANATSPNGAVVSYAASATDDIDGTVPVACAPPSGSTFPIGTTTVTCAATDASGNTANASFTVHVKGAAEQVADLIALVDSYNLRQLGTALHEKLVKAQQFLAANKPKRACERLDAFLGQIKEQRGKRLSVEQADRLTADARRIRAVIAC